MLDHEYISILSFILKCPLKSSPCILLGVCTTSWMRGGLSSEMAQAVSFPEGQQGTADTLYPGSHPPSHPQSLAGEDRGCPWLAPGMPKCQLRGFGSRNLFFNPSPAVTKTKAESLFLKLTTQGNKIASPPVFTAEGRGQREGMALWDATSRKWSSVCQCWDANVTEEAAWGKNCTTNNTWLPLWNTLQLF